MKGANENESTKTQSFERISNPVILSEVRRPHERSRRTPSPSVIARSLPHFSSIAAELTASRTKPVIHSPFSTTKFSVPSASVVK